MNETTKYPEIANLSQVSLRYGDGPEIINRADASIRKGQFCFVTGQSGSGKTSLLRLLYLMKKPSRGQLSLFGKPYNTLSPADVTDIRRNIGVVFQDFRLMQEWSVYDNVALPLRIRGKSNTQIKDNVLEFLSWLKLEDVYQQKVATLSGGQMQRVAIARAVIFTPQLILADEPTGNIDDNIANDIMRIFVSLNLYGITIVFATHNTQLRQRLLNTNKLKNTTLINIQQGRTIQSDI